MGKPVVMYNNIYHFTQSFLNDTSHMISGSFPGQIEFYPRDIWDTVGSQFHISSKIPRTSVLRLTLLLF